MDAMSVSLRDMPLPKHCMVDVASATAMHLDEPPMTKKHRA